MIGVICSSSKGYSSTARAWKARIEANGGTITAKRLRLWDSKIFKPFSDVIAAADYFGIYVAENELQALSPAITKGSNLITKVGTITFMQNVCLRNDDVINNTPALQYLSLGITTQQIASAVNNFCYISGTESYNAHNGFVNPPINHFSVSRQGGGLIQENFRNASSVNAFRPALGVSHSGFGHHIQSSWSSADNNIGLENYLNDANVYRNENNAASAPSNNWYAQNSTLVDFCVGGNYSTYFNAKHYTFLGTFISDARRKQFYLAMKSVILTINPNAGF